MGWRPTMLGPVQEGSESESLCESVELETVEEDGPLSSKHQSARALTLSGAARAVSDGAHVPHV